MKIISILSDTNSSISLCKHRRAIWDYIKAYVWIFAVFEAALENTAKII